MIILTADDTLWMKAVASTRNAFSVVEEKGTCFVFGDFEIIATIVDAGKVDKHIDRWCFKCEHGPLSGELTLRVGMQLAIDQSLLAAHDGYSHYIFGREQCKALVAFWCARGACGTCGYHDAIDFHIPTRAKATSTFNQHGRAPLRNIDSAQGPSLPIRGNCALTWCVCNRANLPNRATHACDTSLVQASTS